MIGATADFVIPVPPIFEWLQPLLVALPLQLSHTTWPYAAAMWTNLGISPRA
jgi:hypothetical protein